jgi:acyl-CoA dehydrogenase
MALPIGITVEGSNIVTRSLIIFGQGLIRCHPYALKEMETLENGDVKGFDKAFWGHIGLTIRNTFRSILLSITRGYLSIPPNFGPTAKYYRKLSWTSATFSFLADLALASLGGELKKKEKLSGYFADVLTWQYMATCALRKYEADGRQKADLPLVKWCCENALVNIQRGFDNIFNNFPVPFIGKIFSGPVAVWSRFNALSSTPNDKLGSQVARILLQPGEARDRLTHGYFQPSDKNEQASLLERSFNLAHKNTPIYKKIGQAMRQGKIKKARPKYVLGEALEAGVITQDEYNNVVEMEKLRDDVVAVDSFDHKEMPVQLPDPGIKKTKVEKVEV